MEIKKKLGLIFGILGIFLCLVMNANALTMEYKESVVLPLYARGVSNSYYQLGFPQDNFNISFGNESANFDLKYHIENINSPFFMSIVVTEPQNITIIRQDPVEKFKITTNLEIDEAGKHILYFEPTRQGESAIIFIDVLGESEFFEVYTQDKKSAGLSDTMDFLVGSANDLIDINIGFWKLGYYLVVFVLALTSVLILFSLAFILFKVVKSLKQNSKENHKKTRDKEEN